MGRMIKIWLIVLLASFMCTESQAQLGRILSNASKTAGSGLFSKKKKGKEIEVKDPKTGKIKKIRYTYRDWKTEDIYAKRGNWRDEAMLNKIIRGIHQQEEFDNSKRSADDPMKDRKIADIVMESSNWKIERTDLGATTRRIAFVYLICELTSGEDIVEFYYVESPYEGNSFSDNFNIGWARQYAARFNVSLNDWVRTAKDSLPQKYKALYGSTILKESSFIQSLTT